MREESCETSGGQEEEEEESSTPPFPIACAKWKGFEAAAVGAGGGFQAEGDLGEPKIRFR